MKSIREPARDIPVVAEVEVLVVGGGPAGIAAAVAAGRAGARTVLVERYGFFGGMATAGLVGPILGVYHWASRRRILGGIPWELLNHMSQNGGARLGEKGMHVPFDPEVLKRSSAQMIMDAGVSVRAHSFAAGVVRDGRRLTAVILESKSGRQAVTAGVVVDATGDADVAAAAGATFEYGRHGDHRVQPLTMVFRLGNVDTRRLSGAHDPKEGYVVTNVRDKMLRAAAEGNLPAFGGPWIMKGSTVRDNEAFVNVVRLWGSSLDVDQMTANEIAGREQVAQFVEFFRENVPGLEDCHLIDTGAQIGVRESRRIKGTYQLTESDLCQARSFADAIALGGHIIDIHSPGADSEQRRESVPAYQIPYGCLVPVDLDNCLVAGRPISATHAAHASTRVMGTCMALGQAAGTAAALVCHSDGIARSVDVKRLQETLRDTGAVLE
jgi:glycine/D-amino acid oxidase-like deaminating enzyme